jgi:hypothetical protein
MTVHRKKSDALYLANRVCGVCRLRLMWRFLLVFTRLEPLKQSVAEAAICHGGKPYSCLPRIKLSHAEENGHPMRMNERLLAIRAPLRRDSEERRWYDEQAASCLVLTRRGRLLEPTPTFGPTSYRLLACKVSPAEARAYAAARELRHERTMPSA